MYIWYRSLSIMHTGSPIVKAVEMLEGLQAGLVMRFVASWFGALLDKIDN